MDQLANLLDYSGWTEGTGNSGTWYAQGNDIDIENVRLYDYDPWNKQSLVWQIRAQDDTGYGGGFHSPLVYIDYTATYRFSIYLNRLGAVGERTLFGFNAYNESTIRNILRIGDGAVNTNPYLNYWYNSSYLNEWVLLIGYLRPYGTSYLSDKLPEGGVYQMDGTRIELAEFEWIFYTTDTNRIRMRCFYYDSGDKWPTFIENMAYPRIEKCDGTELSLENLLRGPYPMFLGPSAGDLLVKVTTWH